MTKAENHTQGSVIFGSPHLSQLLIYKCKSDGPIFLKI